MSNISLNEGSYRALSLSSIVSSIILILNNGGITASSSMVILFVVLIFCVSSIHLVLGRKLSNEDLLLGLPIPISLIYVFISIGDLLPIVGVDVNNFSIEYSLFFMIIKIITSNLLFGSDSEFDSNDIVELNFNTPTKSNLFYCVFILLLSLTAGAFSKNDLDVANYIFVLTILFSPLVYLREQSSNGSTNILVFSTSLSIMILSTSSVDYASNYDISRDVYHSTLAIENSSINLVSSSSYSTILSIQAFLPWLSIVFGVPIDVCILVSHSIILSLGMLIIHGIYQSVFSNPYSGLAVYFPMTSVQFFVGQMDLWRQGVSELALFSIVSISVLHSFRKGERRLLVRLFLIFTVLSHYSIGYVFLIIFIFANLGNYLLNRTQIVSITEETDAEEDVSFDDDTFLVTSVGEVDVSYRNPGFSVADITVTAFFMISWHTLSGNSFVINEVLLLLRQSLDQILTMSFFELFTSTQVAEELSSENQFFHRLSALSTGAIIFFGLIGLTIEINKKPQEAGLINLISMAIGATVLVALLLIIPGLGYRLNVIRFVQWAIIFISPFTLSFIIYASGLRPGIQNDSGKQITSRAIMFTLGALIILNSGFLFEVNKENPRWNLESESDSPSLSHSEYFAGEFATIFSDTTQYPRECIASDKNRQGSMVRFVSEKNISYATNFHLTSAGITVHGQWNLEKGTYYLRDPLSNNRLIYQTIDDFWLRDNSVIFDAGSAKVYYYPCVLGVRIA